MRFIGNKEPIVSEIESVLKQKGLLRDKNKLKFFAGITRYPGVSTLQFIFISKAVSRLVDLI